MQFWKSQKPREKKNKCTISRLYSLCVGLNKSIASDDTASFWYWYSLNHQRWQAAGTVSFVQYHKKLQVASQQRHEIDKRSMIWQLNFIFGK